jgi:hypothetical protein
MKKRRGGRREGEWEGREKGSGIDRRRVREKVLSHPSSNIFEVFILKKRRYMCFLYLRTLSAELWWKIAKFRSVSSIAQSVKFDLSILTVYVKMLVAIDAPI